MSAEKKAEHIESFRENFQLINEIKINKNDGWTVRTALARTAVVKNEIKNKSLSLDERKPVRSTSDYGDGLKQVIIGDKYLLELIYPNEANYPTLAASPFESSRFRENKSPLFFKSKSKEILTNFLGNDYEKLNAKLMAVMKNRVYINITIDNPREFDQLVLEDQKLLNLFHIGNPPPSGSIHVMQ